jgi:hypothetical protein
MAKGYKKLNNTTQHNITHLEQPLVDLLLDDAVPSLLDRLLLLAPAHTHTTQHAHSGHPSLHPPLHPSAAMMKSNART